MEACFRADLLAASRRREPSVRARSIMSVLSESEGLEWRRRSNDRSRGVVVDKAKKESKRESMSTLLGFGMREGSEEEQGRLDMEGESRRVASIILTEWRKERLARSLTLCNCNRKKWL